MDDILVIWSNIKGIQEVQPALHAEFTIKDLSSSYYLGLEIIKTDKGLDVVQSKFDNDLLIEIEVSKNLKATTPCLLGLQLRLDGEPFPNPKPV